MGHSGGAVVEPAGCRVLPVIEEEPDAESEGSPEMTRMAERRKAVVSRMRELLSRAAAAQSAHSNLRRSTVATAKKWKRVVDRIRKREAACRDHEQEDGMLSSSSSISSKSSFSWDAAAAESCCSSALSPANCSLVLWPALVAAQAETADQRQVSSPATSIIRLSSCASSQISSWSEDDDTRMAHWVTTDSDFVVLEL